MCGVLNIERAPLRRYPNRKGLRPTPDKPQTKGNPAETTKTSFRRFYEEVFSKGDAAARKYLSKDYRQHNPMVPTGQQSFIDFFTGFANQAPGMKLDVKRMIADPEFVVIHSS